MHSIGWFLKRLVVSHLTCTVLVTLCQVIFLNKTFRCPCGLTRSKVYYEHRITLQLEDILISKVNLGKSILDQRLTI